jgi:hypothetical protein
MEITRNGGVAELDVNRSGKPGLDDCHFSDCVTRIPCHITQCFDNL